MTIYNYQNMSNEELRQLILSTEIPENFDKKIEFRSFVDEDILYRIFDVVLDKIIDDPELIIIMICTLRKHGYKTIKFHLRRYLVNLKKRLEAFEKELNK